MGYWMLPGIVGAASLLLMTGELVLKACTTVGPGRPSCKN